MHARVEKSIEASNGMIFAIDKVLQPPCQVTEQLFTIPTTFSTFGAALERTGLSSKVDNEKGLTVMAPSNKAWEMLGFENLKYLFSCVGQEREGGSRHGRYDQDDEREGRKPQCQGVKDLKKILEFHVGKEVAYSTDFMNKKETTLETLCGHEMTVCAKRKQGGGESDEDDRRRRDRKDRKGRKDEGDEHRDVREYNFMVNDGEARIQFTDGLASNAAIHVVDNIMVPENVNLPYDRWSNM
ncbi:hypothetical protein HKX48_001002 [Thoreauomyces humboldtii]|nr:hypothetical protein HKX48_001002 [Thoreauomyces humboldtii]